MKEFALIFRQPVREVYPTEEEMRELLKEWYAWIDDLAAQGKHRPGVKLGYTGKVLRAGGIITDGPFVELKEELGGFIIVLADNLDEAVTLAHGCPGLKQNGSVEVREIYH